MSLSKTQILKTVIRWTIAIGGIAWVISNMQLRDSVTLLLDDNVPVRAVLDETQSDDDQVFTIRDPETGEPTEVPRSRLINPPDRSDNIVVELNGRPQSVPLLGMRLAGNINRNPDVRELLVHDPQTDANVWVSPQDVPDGFRLRVPKPLVESGLIAMVKTANPWLLMASLAVFPLTFLMTTVRWWGLLHAVHIPLTLGRVFVLNVVGCFYNSFMLGTMGGDVVKAFYVARQSPHKTAAIMSVLFDRLIGLLTLVMIGGMMAAYQVLSSNNLADPTTIASRQVALVAAIILLGFVFMFSIVLHPAARKALKIDLLLNRLPMKRVTHKVIDTMETYRGRPKLILWAVLCTVPVHVAVIISAMLAGMAFGLPISYAYYFVVIPVIVLVGSMPISPQGAGVMEFFAILLTAKQGATVSEAFALTMSVRVVQILWNLMGGIWVMRGGFAAPTPAQEEAFEDEVEQEEEALPATQP